MISMSVPAHLQQVCVTFCVALPASKPSTSSSSNNGLRCFSPRKPPTNPHSTTAQQHHFIDIHSHSTVLLLNICSVSLFSTVIMPYLDPLHHQGHKLPWSRHSISLSTVYSNSSGCWNPATVQVLALLAQTKAIFHVISPKRPPQPSKQASLASLTSTIKEKTSAMTSNNHKRLVVIRKAADIHHIHDEVQRGTSVAELVSIWKQAPWCHQMQRKHTKAI